ncbi:MAG: hypothetical protein KDD34_08635, partial [Bdellovibrionales bacterium]|nr:hypothetical protein [Bdellovibrionales bacterium]
DAPQIPSLDALAQDELPQIPTLPDEEPHEIPSIPALENEVPDSSVSTLDLQLPDIPSNTDFAQPEGLNFESASQSQTSSEEVPEGLDIEMHGGPDAPEGFVMETPPAVVAIDENTSNSSDSAPEGFSLELPPVPASIEEPPAEQMTEPVALPEDSPVSVKTTDPEASKKKPEFKLKVPSKDDDTLSEATNVTTTKFGITLTGANKKAPKKAVIDTENMAPHDAESAQSESEAAAWLFNELKQNFQHSMILLFESSNIKAWKWENSWKPSSESAFEPFNPDQPGLFRIVQKTKQPYHGYVVDSPINKEFFKNWGYDQYPAHVTALPMKIDGHMTGVVLTIGEKSCGGEANLIATERLVETFSQAILRLSKKAA